MDEQQIAPISGQEPGPWERLPDESGLWYARFTRYRLLGTRRSLRQAYREAKRQEGLRGLHPGQAWRQAVQRFDWRARAEAWDDAERRRWLDELETARLDARRLRLEMIDELQQDAYQALRRANLKALDGEDARRLLSPLRLLWDVTLQAQRLEYGEATDIVAGSASHALGENMIRALDFIYGDGEMEPEEPAPTSA